MGKVPKAQVIILKTQGDNFNYLYQYQKGKPFDCAQGKVFAVDPTQTKAILKTIQKNNFELTDILITHHHWDHTAGIEELKKQTGCQVVGGDKKRIAGIDRIVRDSDVIASGKTKVKVIATPGHTMTSLCYYVLPRDGNDGVVFTGDTLFVGGCGRILEGNAKMMIDSLRKLAQLPDDTKVYCGHDYTIENYEFALTIEPDNTAVKQRLEQLKKLDKKGELTVPSTIALEKQMNIFLRAHTNVKVFAELRKRKDVF